MDRIERILGMIREQPKDSFLRHALALEYIKIGDDAQAEALFTDLLNDDPAYVGSYYHLAKLYERKGEIDKATSCYEKGMQMALSQNDRHAYNELRSALEELTM